MRPSLCRNNQVNVSTKKLYSNTAHDYQVNVHIRARRIFKPVQDQPGSLLAPNMKTIGIAGFQTPFATPSCNRWASCRT